MKKKYIDKCYICKNVIKPTEKLIKIKERMLYEDNDGVWYNFRTAHICSTCLTKIRQETKRGE